MPESCKKCKCQRRRSSSTRGRSVSILVVGSGSITSKGLDDEKTAFHHRIESVRSHGHRVGPGSDRIPHLDHFPRRSFQGRLLADAALGIRCRREAKGHRPAGGAGCTLAPASRADSAGGGQPQAAPRRERPLVHQAGNSWGCDGLVPERSSESHAPHHQAGSGGSHSWRNRPGLWRMPPLRRQRSPRKRFSRRPVGKVHPSPA